MRRNLEEKELGTKKEGGEELQGPATQPSSYTIRYGVRRKEKVCRKASRPKIDRIIS